MAICGLELAKRGVFEKYGVEVLGTPVAVIEATEDRQLFTRRLAEIGVRVPRGVAVVTKDDAVQKAREVGFPVMIRVLFTLGGLGSGVCFDAAQVAELAEKALAYSPLILVEEYLEESIVVAPGQTLTNSEYHMLRSLAIKVIRHLGIVGECNIQYALDPRSDDYRVSEVNARLSRSSALAPKATGYLSPSWRPSWRWATASSTSRTPSRGRRWLASSLPLTKWWSRCRAGISRSSARSRSGLAQA